MDKNKIMTRDLYTLFAQEIETPEQQAELVARVFTRIESAQAKKIKIQKIIWMTTSFVFSFVVIFTGIRVVSGMISSNFGDYFSLIFSDTTTALSIWKELSISIVDSLPIIGIGLFLASICLLFWSAKKYSISSKTLAY